MILEQGSWSPTPGDIFLSSSASKSIKDVSSLASDNAQKCGFKSSDTDYSRSDICENDAIFSENIAAVDDNSFSDPLYDVAQTSNTVFEISEEKNSSDFLYYGWPELGCFDDVDRMFRNCEKTFGIGTSKEEKINWLPAANAVGDCGDMLQSDFKFPLLEPHMLEDIPENLDTSNSYSVNDSAAPNMFDDSSWSAKKSESYMSVVTMNEPATVDAKEELNPKEQVGNREQLQNQLHSENNKRKKPSENMDFVQVNELPRESEQCPSRTTSCSVFPSVCNKPHKLALGPYCCNYLQNTDFLLHQDSCDLSYQNSVDTSQSLKQHMTKDLINPEPMELAHASSYLQSNSNHPSLNASNVEGNQKKGHRQNCQRTLLFQNRPRGNTGPVLETSSYDTDLEGKFQFSGGKFEKDLAVEGVNPVIPAALGTSNEYERSTLSFDLDEKSPETASFIQLLHVMQQLDLKTKLCIRDSLYRLAQSAEQRHIHANSNGVCRDEIVACGAFVADGISRHPGFFDTETDTNPIDRTIAHLLFHRPADSTATPKCDSMSVKSPRMVNGSLFSSSATVNNLVGEKTSCETKKQDFD